MALVAIMTAWKTGSADLIDRHRTDGMGQPRADGRLSGRCLTQSRAEHASHQDFVDPITRQLDAFHGFGDGEASELGCRD
jgi:hypothetical protein